MKADSTMMLRPPIWINSMITTCPKVEKSVGVSSVARPVTHTALVAVNSASIGEIERPSPAEIGKLSSTVPTAMIAKKVQQIRISGRPKKISPAEMKLGSRTISCKNTRT